MPQTRWLPLESNPEVMNKYVEKLGVSGDYKFSDVYDLSEDGLKSIPRPVIAVLLLFPGKYVQSLGIHDTWQFFDVWGLEPELLLTVPRPICAVLLLYPITEKSESTKFGDEEEGSGLYFIKQTIGNACGTIGIIHALCNNSERLGFDKEKHLSQFFGDTKDLSPAERGKYLESDEAFGEAHEEVALEGQTQAPSRDDRIDLHFVAFVHHNGSLYELDGRRGGPVRHGTTTEDSLLEDSAEIVKKFMARDPENLNFTVVALAKA